MFTGASQTTEHECELSEVLQPIVQQKPRCSFIRLGRPPKCALGAFVAGPTCSLHLPDPEPHSLAVWIPGNVDRLHNLSSSYVNTEDSPLVHSPYQNPVVCGCAGLGERMELHYPEENGHADRPGAQVLADGCCSDRRQQMWLLFNCPVPRHKTNGHRA